MTCESVRNLDEMIFEMSYSSYRYNRLRFPARSAEGYAPVFPNWAILEERFQADIKQLVEVQNER